MAKLTKMTARYRFKCVCCGEHVRTCEPYLQVEEYPSLRPRKGERYCVRCEKYARLNNDDIDGEVYDDQDDNDDGESFLRSMEDHAAYRAAGLSSDAYLQDRNEGYCN